MDRVGKFQRQHRELTLLAREIGAKLHEMEQLRSDASAVRQQIARFLGKLKVHAAMEDGALYPELLAHDDPNVRDKARNLQRGLGPIYARFDNFGRSWLTPGAIEEDPARFVTELVDAFAVLRRRMVEEQASLYPLVRAVAS